MPPAYHPEPSGWHVAIRERKKSNEGTKGPAERHGVASLQEGEAAVLAGRDLAQGKSA